MNLGLAVPILYKLPLEAFPESNEDTGSVPEEYEEYPDDDIIHIIDDELTHYGHVNTFTNEFMNHIRNMDPEIYSTMSYSGWVKMRLLSNYDNSYYWINSYTYLKELTYDYQYINYEYDLLEGRLPNKKEDLVLVIDKNNCINRDVLNSLGIETNNLESIRFSDIIGKTYKVITPDIYYKKDNNRYRTYSSMGYSINDIYNEATLELSIQGIVRQNKKAKTKLYTTSILYSPLLTDYLLEYNNSCEIVKDQKENPTLNVLTGLPFEEIKTDYSIQTIEYQYENNLINFGANFTIVRILIYTDKFENFENFKKAEIVKENTALFIVLSYIIPIGYYSSTGYVDVTSCAIPLFKRNSTFLSS